MASAIGLVVRTQHETCRDVVGAQGRNSAQSMTESAGGIRDRHTDRAI